MEKVIITSGKKYIDIDAYASIFAYKRLLNHLGYEAYAYNKGVLNESISPLILELGFTFDDVTIQKEDKVIILAVSNPDFFYDIKDSQIKEIIDHHTGYEEYWKKRNVYFHMEFIGSICTIIYEKYKENNKCDLLDRKMCQLLMAGILDNTLNLKAKITTKKDELAYLELQQIGGIKDSFKKDYFTSCYKDLENNFKTYIENDSKEVKRDNFPAIFGQLIVLTKDFAFNNKNVLKDVYKGKNWCFNLIVLEEGSSYIFFDETEKTKKELEDILSIKPTNDYFYLKEAMLRKEILKKVEEKTS